MFFVIKVGKTYFLMDFALAETWGHWHNGAVGIRVCVPIRRLAPYGDSRTDPHTAPGTMALYEYRRKKYYAEKDVV